MNYFLLLIILIMCGGFYYVHQQDQQQITALQAQLDSAPPPSRGPAPGAAGNGTSAASSAGNGLLPKDASLPGASPYASNLQSAPAAKTQPIVAVLPPDASRSSAIDSAAQAATAAQNSNSLGTITTLDGHTYQDCRVLKIESDGVTFNHADGITKILYPLLPPDMQKKFGYDPHAAVAQTEAQINYQQQVQQAASTTGTTPATTGTNP